jgi:hypothetical protein
MNHSDTRTTSSGQSGMRERSTGWGGCLLARESRHVPVWQVGRVVAAVRGSCGC